MYEVASATAYTPQAWTPPRPRSDYTSYSPRSSSPTKSPTPRKPLLGSGIASSPAINQPLPRIPPPQPSRYRNSTSRSPDRNRRSAAAPAEPGHKRTGTMDSSDSRWSPMGPNSYSAPSQRPSMHHQHDSYNSQAPIVPVAAYGAQMSDPSPPRHNRFGRLSSYDDPYAGVSPSPARHSRYDSELDAIDPHNIADDDEPLGSTHYGHRSAGNPAGAAAVGGATGGAAAILGAFRRDGSGSYGRAPGGPDRFDGAEKSAWRDMENRDRKSRKRTVLIILGIVLVLAIAGAVVGGVLGTRKSHNSISSTHAGSSSDSSLNADSDEIKKLMNNKDLHRVFPAMDYTGLNMQYPDCLSERPSQDNVTMDMAMMSQLTPAVRVYGTDCNQTEMVLTAIDRLNMNDTMNVWLGVWLANNDTTNARQLNQLYDILDKYPATHFKGIIVGNEVLFRKDMTLEQLGAIIDGVKQNLTDMKIDLPVATSDLGSNWTPALSKYSDLVMANVHPFFAGVTVDQAASWTYTFWENNDVAVTGAGTEKKNVISEVGWPSQGGNDCGTGNTCASKTDGSVAGIDEMNTFMDQWVCQAMTNGTQYFWFEAFDEPWKIIYDTKDDNWEDHWGLMTVDRQLKDGVKIPDCGGKTIK